MNESHNRYANQPVIVLKWRIGQRVKIPAADAVGTVYSAVVSRDGIEYSVKYFTGDGIRVCDFFQASELAGDD